MNNRCKHIFQGGKLHVLRMFQHMNKSTLSRAALNIVNVCDKLYQLCITCFDWDFDFQLYFLF